MFQGYNSHWTMVKGGWRSYHWLGRRSICSFLAVIFKSKTKTFFFSLVYFMERWLLAAITSYSLKRRLYLPSSSAHDSHKLKYASLKRRRLGQLIDSFGIGTYPWIYVNKNPPAVAPIKLAASVVWVGTSQFWPDRKNIDLLRVIFVWNARWLGEVF